MRHYSPLANVFDSFTRIAVHGVHIGQEKRKARHMVWPATSMVGPPGFEPRTQGL